MFKMLLDLLKPWKCLDDFKRLDERLLTQGSHSCVVDFKGGWSNAGAIRS